MNDLEKQKSEELDNACDNAGKMATEKIAELVDNTSEACEIDSSPSLDLAEAADRISQEEDKENSSVAQDETKEKNSEALEDDKEAEPAVNYHLMTKEELLDALKNIVASGNLEAHKDVAYIKQAFYSKHNKAAAEELEAFVAAGNDPQAFVSTPDETETEIKGLLAEFREKRNAYLEEKEEVKRKNLEEKKRIIEEIKAISEDIDNINLQFSKFQQLQQDFKAVGEVPASADNEIWKSFQTAVEQFYDRLKMNKELRDLDFKKNLELKTLLIEKAKELAEVSDPIEAFRSLQSLHDQWREIGPVSRELREEIWTQFKDASTVINKRHQDYFQERKASEQENEVAKNALCEKAEAINTSELKSFTDWENATKEILELQQAWKGLGFASKKVNNQLFARFRQACDNFFTAKGEYFKKTKEESKENLAKKEALCEKAEALIDKFNEKSAFDQIQALQKEWRTIGMVRRKQGDDVWKRFCAAVDAFYDARKKLFSDRRESENENLKIKKSIIEQLKEISEEEERKDVIEKIRQLQSEWQNTGHVPFKQKDTVNSEYKAELDRLYGAFDIRENRQRMRRYEGEIKKIADDESKLGRERDRLLRAIESRQAELKTIENNMGFFNVKSSAGNSMLKELDRKIQKIKEEISQIQEKIKLLDSQNNNA